MRKMGYGIVGFVLGCLACGIFSARALEAQSAFSKGTGGYSFDTMQPPLPASFGQLVAVSGINLYFQGEGGMVYVVKPRSGNALDTQVTVIPRA